MKLPGRLDSFDALAVARSGGSGPRSLAIAGNQVRDWGRTQGTLFTVFDREWEYDLAIKPESSRLYRHGSLEEVSALHPDVCRRLREAGMDELERRGTDLEIIRWLRSDGTRHFPQYAKFWDRFPAPVGYHSYFDRLYAGT